MIIDLYKSGLSARQISEKLGISQQKVYNALIIAGVERRNPADTAKKLSLQQIQQLQLDYLSGLNTSELSKKYGICVWSVCNYLNKAGVKRRTSAESLEKLTEEQQNKIVRLYETGKSLDACAKSYGVSNGTISRIISKRSTVRLVRRQFDENFFEVIDTPIKAYWFGFLAADGYAKKSGSNYHITINLKAADVGHLEKFKKALKSDHKIKLVSRENPFGRFPSVRFELSSKKMVEDLHRNGLYKFKSECVMPLLHNNLQNHFWRGFMDGDGWICFYKNKRDRKGIDRGWAKAVLGFCGDKRTMEQLRDILIKCGANNNKVIPNGTIWRIQYAGLRQVQRISDWLYRDSESATVLDRKYIIYKLISEYKRANTT